MDAIDDDLYAEASHEFSHSISSKVTFCNYFNLDINWWLRQASNLRTSGFSDRRSTKLSYTAPCDP